jgi:predicted Zn-dependent protease
MDQLQGRPRAALLEAMIEFDLAQGAPLKALDRADVLAKEFPRRPNAWFLRAAALQAAGRNLEAARALSSLARRTPADDPVGMGARIGLAAIFIGLEKAETACAMRAKTLSRPNAADNWQTALGVFPRLKDWDQLARNSCSAG